MEAILGFFGGAAGRWLVIVLLVTGAAGAGFMHGIEFQQGEEAKGRLDEADEARIAMLARWESDRRIVAGLVMLLDHERRMRDADSLQFEETLDASRGTFFEANCPPRNEPTRNATGSDAPQSAAPTAQGISEPVRGEADAPGGASPGARLSASGCRVWNDALLGGYTAAERALLPPGADACAGPVEAEDALKNLRANAVRLGECRFREQRTQAWLRGVGLAKEVP